MMMKGENGMKTVNIFEKGEKVRIDVEVANLVLKGNEIKYELKDPRTGKCFDYVFKEDQITPIPPEERKARKVAEKK